jgi:hypothetical protein
MITSGRGVEGRGVYKCKQYVFTIVDAGQRTKAPKGFSGKQTDYLLSS